MAVIIKKALSALALAFFVMLAGCLPTTEGGYDVTFKYNGKTSADKITVKFETSGVQFEDTIKQKLFETKCTTMATLQWGYNQKDRPYEEYYNECISTAMSEGLNEEELENFEALNQELVSYFNETAREGYSYHLEKIIIRKIIGYKKLEDSEMKVHGQLDNPEDYYDLQNVETSYHSCDLDQYAFAISVNNMPSVTCTFLVKKSDKNYALLLRPRDKFVITFKYKDSFAEGLFDVYHTTPVLPVPENDVWVDLDNDGYDDLNEDNCMDVANPKQEDKDGDGIGDACEEDLDKDGVPDEDDNCVGKYNPTQADFDGDAVGDLCDNCGRVPNPLQENDDEDSLGDACILDSDYDDIPDNEDNCPSVSNSDQQDADGDGAGDVCDNNAVARVSGVDGNSDTPAVEVQKTGAAKGCSIISAAVPSVNDALQLMLVLFAISGMAIRRNFHR